MDIGKQIKKLRTQSNIKSTNFAKKIEVSRVHLSNIESGIKNPSWELFFKICDALNITPKEFFEEEMESKPIDLFIYELRNFDDITITQIEAFRHVLKGFKEKEI